MGVITWFYEKPLKSFMKSCVESLSPTLKCRLAFTWFRENI